MMTQDERAAWLAERRKGLGATDLASVLGVGFRTPAEVYAEKAGDAPEREASGLMLLGLATEPHNAELYERRTGARVISPGLVWSNFEPWAFATFDRLVVEGMPGVGARPVELKYTPFFGDDWGPDGTDQVRDGYVVQGTWQAQILNDRGREVDRIDLSVLAGTGEHRVYHLPFDAALGRLLVQVGREFWARVITRAGVADWEPPLALVDGIADRLAKIRPDTTVALGFPALEMADRYEAHKTAKAAAEEAAEAEKGRMKQVAAELCQLLNGAETGVLPDGRRVQQKTVNVAAHVREASSHVRFSILKPKKGRLS